MNYYYTNRQESDESCKDNSQQINTMSTIHVSYSDLRKNKKLERIAKIKHEQKKIPITVTYYDIGLQGDKVTQNHIHL
jgi:hypothetical protein